MNKNVPVATLTTTSPGPVVSSSVLSSPSSSSSTIIPTDSSTTVTQVPAPISPPIILVGNIPQHWDYEFFNWCIKHGIKCPKLNFPAYMGPQNIRGFLAKEDINSYDDLLVVPSSLIISKSSCYCSQELSKVFTENYRIFEDDEDAVLATFICYHRAVLKDTSFWWPYFRILPDIDVLADWSAQELLALQDPFLMDLALERRAEYDLISVTFTTLLTLQYPDIFPKDKFTPEWFTWAYKQVSARGFGSRLPEVLMVPLADCFNHGNVATKYTFEEHSTVQYRIPEFANSNIQSLRIASPSTNNNNNNNNNINSLNHSPTSTTSTKKPNNDLSNNQFQLNDSTGDSNNDDTITTTTANNINTNSPHSDSVHIPGTISSLPLSRNNENINHDNHTITSLTDQSIDDTNISVSSRNIKQSNIIKEGNFRMFPTRNTTYKSGEPVYFSYGRRDNIHLAMEYGFTLLDNEHDMVVLYPGSITDYGKLFIPPRARTIIDFAKISMGPFKLKWRSLDPNMLTLFRAISVGLDDAAYADFEAGRTLIFNRLMSGPMETAALQRLHAYLYSVLKGMGTSIEEDEMLLNSRDILPARLLTAVRYRLTRKHLIYSHIQLTEERVMKLVKKSSSSSLKAVIAASNNVLASVNNIENMQNIINTNNNNTMNTNGMNNMNMNTNSMNNMNNKNTPIRSGTTIMNNSPSLNNNMNMISNNGTPLMDPHSYVNTNTLPNMYNSNNNNMNHHPDYLPMNNNNINNPPLPNNNNNFINNNNNNGSMMRKMVVPNNNGSPMIPNNNGLSMVPNSNTLSPNISNMNNNGRIFNESVTPSMGNFSAPINNMNINNNTNTNGPYYNSNNNNQMGSMFNPNMGNNNNMMIPNNSTSMIMNNGNDMNMNTLGVSSPPLPSSSNQMMIPNNNNNIVNNLFPINSNNNINNSNGLYNNNIPNTNLGNINQQQQQLPYGINQFKNRQ